MKSKNWLIVAIFLFVAGSAFSQPVSIRTAHGYLFIRNGQSLSFACEVNGKEIKPTTAADNPSFVVDGNLIQMLWIQNSNFDPSGDIDAAKLLSRHRDWEVDYLKSIFLAELKPESESLKLGDREILFWNFRRPKYTTEFDRDAYMTTLMDRDVFGVNSPVKIGESLDAAKERLAGVMRTLRTSKTPYNIEEIAAAIKKGGRPNL